MFRHVDVGPDAGGADSIITNAVTSDKFALNVFDHYATRWTQNGRQLGDFDLSVPNQNGTPLFVRCRVVHVQGRVYVRCSAPSSDSLVTFSDRTLRAGP